MKIVEDKYSDSSRYFTDENGDVISKRTGKKVRSIKTFYGSGCSKTKTLVSKEISKECDVNYINKESYVLQYIKFFEAKVIPFNI